MKKKKVSVEFEVATMLTCALLYIYIYIHNKSVSPNSFTFNPLSLSLTLSLCVREMELIPRPIKGRLKRYWRRQRYERLHGSKRSRKNVQVVRLGDSPSTRVWRMRVIPKLRLKIVSPLRLWTKLKNAYMNTMLSLAGNVGHLSSSNVFGGRRIPKARKVPLNYSFEEIENRLIIEIYKALASRELTPM